ncbi:MAG: AMP-binding protein [Alphaproteobacteria bacterium]|nr:AMP-binding protein [Alphaproteobacteria bacterium]
MASKLISGAREISLAQLGERVERGAAAFASLGIARGDAIALMLRNDFAFFEASGAVGALGGYPVPVNWHFTVDEAGYIIRDSGAKAVVTHADLYPIVSKATPEGVPVLVVDTPPEIAQAYQIDADACRRPANATSWDEWIAGFERLKPEVTDPPGAIIYTSGTTGRPKGVQRRPPTAAQALALTKLISRAFGMYGVMIEQKPERIVTVVTGPMYHSAPNAYGNMSVRAGADIILQPRFDPEELLQMIERHSVTHIHMVPTMFVRLLKLPEAVRSKYDLSSLKFVVHAAAPCPPDVKRAMIEWWGPVINEYYGATETGAVVFCTAEEWLKHPGTVGKPQPDVKLVVLNDAGQEAKAGEAGDVYARLTTASDFTYHGDDEKRRKAERNGLIGVGDIGYVDADGFLYLCDRRNHMVISGGVNIYPAEIEAELLKLHGVADCAVFGIPDAEFGEALCAVVQPQAGANLSIDDVRGFLRDHLAKYKVPKVIEFMSELPREDSGKIFKRKLRDPYWEGAGRKI